MESLLAGLGDVFHWVVRTSIYAVVVVGVIAAVQKLGRRVLTARWSYALWMVLLVRMLLPVSFESDFSAWNLLPQITGGFDSDKSTQGLSDRKTAFTSRKENMSGMAPGAPLPPAASDAAVLMGNDRSEITIGKDSRIKAAVSKNTWLLASGVWLAGALILIE